MYMKAELTAYVNGEDTAKSALTSEEYLVVIWDNGFYFSIKKKQKSIGCG